MVNKIAVIILCLAVVVSANIVIAKNPNADPCTGMTAAVWATRADLNRDTWKSFLDNY